MIVRQAGLTNSQSLSYDPENRLVRFAQANTNFLLVEFGYAGDGTRLWKWINQNPTNLQVWIGNIYEEKGGQTLFHVFADGQQVCTFQTNSVLDGGTITTNIGYYYHEDNLNSSTALSGSGGVQQEVNVYYPFGRQQFASPQASFKVSRQFTGQIKDDETGLYYYNARYYDPLLGRFIQADTLIPALGNPQSYNRYAYVLNNPLKYNDPTGHAWALFDKEAWGQLFHDAFIGDKAGFSSFEPSSKFAIDQAQGRGFHQLYDENGNALGNPATAVGKIVATAPIKTAMILGGPAEDENLLASAGSKLKNLERAATAAGSGPAKGFIEISDAYASSKAVQNLATSKPIDFIFDSQSGRFVMGNNPLGHDGILQAAKISPSGSTVGGTIWRENGVLKTDEWSGHYGMNWTPEIRQQFQNFMQQHGIDVTHIPWGQ
jgi:RHS repeat-associated protein